MNKKLNSFIFMAIATVFNVILIIVFVIIAIILSNLATGYVSEEFKGFLQISGVLSAIALSFIVYHRTMVFITNKYNLEDKLDPIFLPKSKQNKNKK